MTPHQKSITATSFWVAKMLIVTGLYLAEKVTYVRYGPYMTVKIASGSSCSWRFQEQVCSWNMLNAVFHHATRVSYAFSRRSAGINSASSSGCLPYSIPPVRNEIL